jgi:hypothetical protein
VITILDVHPVWLWLESHLECDFFVNVHILDVHPIVVHFK